MIQVCSIHFRGATWDEEGATFLQETQDYPCLVHPMRGCNAFCGNAAVYLGGIMCAHFSSIVVSRLAMYPQSLSQAKHPFGMMQLK